MRRRLFPFFGSLLLFAGSARAEPSPTARADALFDRGKAEMSANHTTAACVLFGESYAIEPSEGTLLALGLCHEKEERLLDAFAELRDVHTSAMKSGREDRQRVARSALARIEPRIGRLVVRSEAPCDSLSIDGQPVAKPDVELPVSAGAHHLSCKRVKVWEGDVTVATGALSVVVVPKPEAPKDEPKPAHGVTHETPKREAEAPGSSLRTLGWVAAGVGVASLGVGTFFGIRSFDQWGNVTAVCPQPRSCRDRDAPLYEDNARSAATIANITIIAGAVLAAAGVYLILTNPSRSNVGMR